MKHEGIIATNKDVQDFWKDQKNYTEDRHDPMGIIVDSLTNDRYKGKVVDVLSVASNTRPNYVWTQRNTWAKHPLVRNFYNVTEDIDGEMPCQNMTIGEVLEVPKWCRKRYMNIPPDSENSSWLMQRFIHFYAREAWLMAKPNPAGWLCAQKRFPIGLATVVLGYVERGESLPDYLLVVDDDTFYNMDVFYDVVVAPRESLDPFVGAGCRVINGKQERGVVFPFGGFGLTFSKASLERLLLPLSIHNDLAQDKWQNFSIPAINENLIFERQDFRDGMNLAELMKNFALAEPFHNISGWTRGFCFHGDWILAIFTHLYGLHSENVIEAIQNSEIRQVDGVLLSTNLCRNEHENCRPTDLVCHYQTPLDMQRLVSGEIQNDDNMFNVSGTAFSLVNHTVTTNVR